MRLRLACLALLLGAAQLASAGSWSREDLDIYDLVEEIGQSFYVVFDVPNDAPLSDIKKAYRRLSMEWHPDRNSAENASDKFRQIAGMYEILKDKELRVKYDEVLENGLPDWRSGIYYYRRVRKMGGAEALALLLVGFSGAHYLMLWGAYFEKYLVESQRKVKPKKGEKKSAKTMDEEETARVEEALSKHRPTWRNALPLVLIQGIYWTAVVLFQMAVERMSRKEEEVEEVEEEKPRRPVQPSVPREEFVYEVADIRAVVAERPADMKEVEEPVMKQEGVWSGEDMATLIRLSTAKFPPGSSNRWQSVARVMGRSVEDVTAAAKRIKHYNPEELSALQNTKTPAMGEEAAADGASRPWSQEEQKLFEAALQKNPKGTPERWERIAHELPGRTKGDVIERFKHLAEMVKQRREKTGGS